MRAASDRNPAHPPARPGWRLSADAFAPAREIRATWQALAILSCLLVAPAAAQTDPAATAMRAAARLDAAAQALDAADSARDRIRALTETIRAFEDGMAALRDALRRATLREAAIEDRFADETGQLAQLLGVLQTMEGTPEATLLLHPDGALGTVRSGLLIADVAPAMAARAAELRAALEELKALRVLQERADATLADGLAGLQDARIALSQAMSDRTDLPRRVVENPAQMARLIEGAETLSAFATSLAELPDAPQDIALPDFGDARGNLDLPVRGRLLRDFDQPDAAGIRRPGWIVATAPAALVTAPWPATVRYAGPLLDYGNVIVLEPGQGFLLVLAGLEQVYPAAGEIVPAGRPVGLMPQAAQSGGGARASETLYIEIREGGTPVDPRGWFRQDEDLKQR